MEQLAINHPRLKMGIKTGTEGPKQDPYGYTEITVTLPDKTVVLRAGIGVKLTINGVEVQPPPKLHWEARERWLVNKAFVKEVGYSTRQLDRFHRKLKERCQKCGGRKFNWVRGFPGEHLNACVQCGEIVDSYFCRSEIE